MLTFRGGQRQRCAAARQDGTREIETEVQKSPDFSQIVMIIREAGPGISVGYRVFACRETLQSCSAAFGDAGGQGSGSSSSRCSQRARASPADSAASTALLSEPRAMMPPLAWRSAQSPAP